MSTAEATHIQDRLRKWYRNIPDLYGGAFRKLWVRALRRGGMRAAIRAKCQDCMAWQNPEIKECDVVTCPLFQYRPFAQKDGALEQEIIASLDAITTDSCS